MFLIKSAENPVYIKEGASWGARTDADKFDSVADAVALVRSFLGDTIDEDIDDTGATIVMSAHARDMRIYEVVPA